MVEDMQAKKNNTQISFKVCQIREILSRPFRQHLTTAIEPPNHYLDEMFIILTNLRLRDRLQGLVIFRKSMSFF